MVRNVELLIRDYQKLIAKLDNRLAQYEQFGTPEQISAKIGQVSESVPYSKVGDVSVSKIKRSSFLSNTKEEQDLSTRASSFLSRI